MTKDHVDLRYQRSVKPDSWGQRSFALWQTDTQMDISDSRVTFATEKQNMKDEGWRMKDEGWRMKDEGWRMKDEGWNCDTNLKVILKIFFQKAKLIWSDWICGLKWKINLQKSENSFLNLLKNAFQKYYLHLCRSCYWVMAISLLGFSHFSSLSC